MNVCSIIMNCYWGMMTSDDPREFTTEELHHEDAATFDVDRIQFVGPRGDVRRHLNREELLSALAELPAAPTDRGTVDLLLARPTEGARDLPEEVLLTIEGGMPGDRWAQQNKYGPNYQLATTRTDFAKVVAAGQPPELHGDNLFVTLDLSVTNLPPGSRVKMGNAVLEVTPQAHNGCKKWVQRVGLAAMKLNMEAEQQRVHLRGVYLRVVEPGRVRLGDAISVLSRGS
jgi:hypothetical protein